MSLKLMYITDRPEIAKIAENSGVDRIFVDMEYIGKDQRQAGLDSVKNHHTVEDVRNIKRIVTKAQVLCRVNPIHDKTNEYCSSEEEINAAIEAGADILMLPFFKTVEEVKRFIKVVDGRVKTMLLVETPQAVEHIDDILAIGGIDEIFIGLNDLSLGYKKEFMFELLADGTVEGLCLKFKKKGIKFGFGGIAGLGQGVLPAELIIKEHYRLDSHCVILSRSFCNTDIITDLDNVEEIFDTGVKEIRNLEEECKKYIKFFRDNEIEIIKRVNDIVGEQ